MKISWEKLSPTKKSSKKKKRSQFRKKPYLNFGKVRRKIIRQPPRLYQLFCQIREFVHKKTTKKATLLQTAGKKTANFSQSLNSRQIRRNFTRHKKFTKNIKNKKKHETPQIIVQN